MQTPRHGAYGCQYEGWLRTLPPILALLPALVLMLGPVHGRAAAPQSDSVAVAFENVELRLFIKFVSETTGRVFLLDDRVRGQVSVVFADKIPVSELYAVLESVLEVKGYAAVPAGRLTKIVPLNTAKQRGIEVGGTRE